MTKEERDNTGFNVIEVETSYNVPCSAKIVLANVPYCELSKQVAIYLKTSGYVKYYPSGNYNLNNFSNELLDKWNSHWEFSENSEYKNFWMGKNAVSRWATYDKDGHQVFHYIFFEKVDK